MIFYNIINKHYKKEYSGIILYKYLLNNVNSNIDYRCVYDQNSIIKYNTNDYIYYEDYNTFSTVTNTNIIGTNNNGIKLKYKILQYKLFNEYMPISILYSKNNIFNIYNDFKFSNIYVTLDDSSGGNGSFIFNVVNDKKKLDVFIYNLFFKNKYSSKIRVTKFLRLKKNVCCHIICFKDGYIQLEKTNQVMREYVKFKYAFYPNNLTAEEDKKIDDIIKGIAEILINKFNVIGIIGFDFMIDENDNIYLAEINPRKMNSTCIQIPLSTVNYNIPIPIIEWYACSGKSVDDVKVNINCIYKWSFMKIPLIERKHNISNENFRTYWDNIKKKDLIYFEDINIFNGTKETNRIKYSVNIC